MPYKDPQKRRERQKQYRQTRQGQEAAQRSRDKFYAKRRAKHNDAPPVFEATALASVMGTWALAVEAR